MTDLSFLNWLNYSGAPPLLLPLSLAQEWRGFYIPLPPGDDDDPDVDLIIGEDHFLISDDFDFDHPVSDYERLCNIGQTAPPVFLMKVGNASALVFNTVYDNIAYWPEKNLFLSGADDFIDETLLETLDWKKILDWSPDCPELQLMNSCDHGAAPVAYKDSHLMIRLSEPVYSISFAIYRDVERDIYLYRFQADSN